MQTNYGAVLQAYALQTYLRNRGAQSEIVDFTTAEHLKAYNVFQPLNIPFFKRMAVYLLVALRYFHLKRRIRRTIAFKKQYFNFTKRYSTVEEILNNPPQEDIYISGSDQVFNLSSPYYEVYYLNFNKGTAKKVAYAASFGHADFTVELKEKITPYLLDFDLLSCRESTGAQFLSSITGKPVPTVVDPTMLLSEEQWRKVTIYPNMKDYIFIYDLNGGEDLIEIAKRLKALIHKPIVCLTCGATNYYRDADRVFVDAGPAEFLGWIANAAYVVTDSFHGTSFSLIFSKPFLNYVAIERASDRVTTILQSIGMEDRMIRCEEIDSYDYKSHLECTEIKNKKWIMDSMSYIDTLLE